MDAKLTERGYSLVVDKLQKLDSAVVVAMKIGLARGLLKTVGVVQTQYLQGPRPAKLGEISTRLRQSIASSATTDGLKVTGRIGSNVRYAAYHEFGFHGVEHVGSYTRVVNRVAGPGKQIGPLVIGQRFVQGGGSGGKKAAAKDKTGFTTFEIVRDHDRHIDYAGRPFVAPALKQMLPVIIQDINDETRKAIDA